MDNRHSLWLKSNASYHRKYKYHFLGDGGGIITIRPLFEAAGIFSGFK